MKHNTFDKEQDKNYQKKYKPLSKENLYYNPEEDCYVCPMGQKMQKTHQSKRTTEAGYQQSLSHYQAKTARVAHCEDNVLKPKETGASRETTTLKDTNKEQENYC